MMVPYMLMPGQQVHGEIIHLTGINLTVDLGNAKNKRALDFKLLEREMVVQSLHMQPIHKVLKKLTVVMLGIIILQY